jgi:hypothetical protein
MFVSDSITTPSNAPRNRPTAFQSTFTSSDFDPLASSTASYMPDVDPWSGVPSPSGTPAPAAANSGTNNGGNNLPSMTASTPNLGSYVRPVQAMMNRMPSGFAAGGGMISPGGGAAGYATMDKPAVLASGMNMLCESCTILTTHPGSFDETSLEQPRPTFPANTSCTGTR